MNDTEKLIYAAGFFDGEGHISIIAHKRNSNAPHRVPVVYALKIGAAQNDPSPLHLLKSLFGGSVAQARESIWRWQLTTKQAADALSRLRPYLIVKAEQADIAIRFQSRRPALWLHPRARRAACDPAADASDKVDLLAAKQRIISLGKAA